MAGIFFLAGVILLIAPFEQQLIPSNNLGFISMVGVMSTIVAFELFRRGYNIGERLFG